MLQLAPSHKASTRVGLAWLQQVSCPANKEQGVLSRMVTIDCGFLSPLQIGDLGGARMHLALIDSSSQAIRSYCSCLYQNSPSSICGCPHSWQAANLCPAGCCRVQLRGQ